MMPAWLPAALTIATIWGGSAFILAKCLLSIKHHPTGIHAGPYMPSSNPFRIGATVLIQEGGDYPSWNGVVMNMGGGIVSVRDTVAPYDVIDVHRSHVFPFGSVL